MAKWVEIKTRGNVKEKCRHVAYTSNLWDILL